MLRECSLHEGSGKCWIGLPPKPRIDSTGQHQVDQGTGKKRYSPVVEIAGKAERERFQAAAIEAVDKLLAKGAAP